MKIKDFHQTVRERLRLMHVFAKTKSKDFLNNFLSKRVYNVLSLSGYGHGLADR